MGLAQNINALLDRFNISPEGFACMIDVSPATVSRWRSGSMNMRESTLQRICEVFELKPDDILSESNGLAAQMYGTLPASLSRVPLITDDDIAQWEKALAEDRVVFIEVPSSVTEAHPRAFAFAVPDDAMQRVIPAGAHAVVDPDAAPENASIAVVQVHTHPGATLRRCARGNQTTVLSTEGPGACDDLVLTDDIGGAGGTGDAGGANGDRVGGADGAGGASIDGASGSDTGGADGPRIIGTVVWFQAPGLLE